MPKKRCPYCFHPSLDELPAPDRHELENINAEIQSLDRSVVELSRKRALLLRKLNDAQPSLSILPGETLSLIFQFACHPPVFGDFPGKGEFEGNPVVTEETLNDWYSIYPVLGDVSVYWRETLMGTPQLWTDAVITISSGNVQDSSSFLLQFLQNSGNLPLALSLHYDQNFAPSAGVLIDSSIDDVLQANFRRIRNLHLTNPPPRWFSSSLPSLCKISHFSLNGTEELALPSIAFGPTYTPTELTLVKAPNIELSCLSFVTTLNLMATPLDTFYYILTQCPKLAKLSVRNPRFIFDETAKTPPVETFTLSHLEIMDWSIMNDSQLDGPWQIALLNRISLPKLRYLGWHHPPFLSFPPAYVDAARTFFARLPIALAELELSGMRGGPVFETPFAEIFLKNLHNQTHIQHLIFTECAHSEIMEVLYGLQSPPETARFPMLRSITINRVIWSVWTGGTIDYAKARQKAEVALAHLLGDILKCRLSGASESFVFTLNVTLGERDSEWINHAQSTFAELKTNGVKLEIYLDSRTVSWC